MADLNIFAHEAFSMTSMSTAIQAAPYAPQLLGQLGIFTTERSRTTTVAIEEKGGVLSLIKTSPRGAPIEEGKGESRRMRHFDTLRIARGKTLYASSVQNIRAFGSVSELQAVQNELADKVGSWVTVIMGAIFVACVLAFRRGIVGEIQALIQRAGIR